MDNKETLKQNNSRIDINNTDLASILITINNLPVQKEIKLQEKSITPSTTEQEVTADEEYTGLSKVTVAGDENLIADNIKEGTSIFGVEGNAKTTNVKITDANSLFRGDARIDYLEEIIALIDTDNVTDMGYMFYNCSKITKVDLRNINTSMVKNMSNMFYLCNNLLYLDIRNFTFDKVTSYSSMFYRVQANCEIIVKGDTEKEWVLTQRSDFTNVKTVAELGE